MLNIVALGLPMLKQFNSNCIPLNVCIQNAFGIASLLSSESCLLNVAQDIQEIADCVFVLRLLWAKSDLVLFGLISWLSSSRCRATRHNQKLGLLLFNLKLFILVWLWLSFEYFDEAIYTLHNIINIVLGSRRRWKTKQVHPAKRCFSEHYGGV